MALEKDMTRTYPSNRGYAALRSLAVLFGLLLLPPGPLAAAGSSGDGQSVHVVLSREFFEAMAKLGQTGTTYGDRQEVWLEKIALSCQYAVKTNLTLIQQQERVIRLLEELARQCPRQDLKR